MTGEETDAQEEAIQQKETKILRNIHLAEAWPSTHPCNVKETAKV